MGPGLWQSSVGTDKDWFTDEYAHVRLYTGWMHAYPAWVTAYAWRSMHRVLDIYVMSWAAANQFLDNYEVACSA